MKKGTKIETPIKSFIKDYKILRVKLIIHFFIINQKKIKIQMNGKLKKDMLLM